jgi:hypothetical protein
MISEIMHMKEVAALLVPFLLWPQVGIIKTVACSNNLSEHTKETLQMNIRAS